MFLRPQSGNVSEVPKLQTNVSPPALLGFLVSDTLCFIILTGYWDTVSSYYAWNISRSPSTHLKPGFLRWCSLRTSAYSSLTFTLTQLVLLRYKGRQRLRGRMRWVRRR